MAALAVVRVGAELFVVFISWLSLVSLLCLLRSAVALVLFGVVDGRLAVLGHW